MCFFIHIDLEMAYFILGEAILIRAAAWVSLMPHREGFLRFQSRLLLGLSALWPRYLTLIYHTVVSVLSTLTGCIMAIWWLQCITEADSKPGCLAQAARSRCEASKWWGLGNRNDISWDRQVRRKMRHSLLCKGYVWSFPYYCEGCAGINGVREP